MNKTILIALSVMVTFLACDKKSKETSDAKVNDMKAKVEQYAFFDLKTDLSHLSENQKKCWLFYSMLPILWSPFIGKMPMAIKMNSCRKSAMSTRKHLPQLTKDHGIDSTVISHLSTDMAKNRQVQTITQKILPKRSSKSGTSQIKIHGTVLFVATKMVRL